MYDYLCQQTSGDAREMINPYVAMGTGLTSLANRISYVFQSQGSQRQLGHGLLQFAGGLASGLPQFMERRS